MSERPERPSAISATASGSHTCATRYRRTPHPSKQRRKTMPNYYPVMLDIRDRLAIVVGGDQVAAEKAAALSASGARVRVISPDFCNELLQQAENRRVTLQRKAYEPGALAGAFVVIAAINDLRLAVAVQAATEIYTLSLHDALPTWSAPRASAAPRCGPAPRSG